MDHFLPVQSAYKRGSVSCLIRLMMMFKIILQFYTALESSLSKENSDFLCEMLECQGAAGRGVNYSWCSV